MSATRPRKRNASQKENSVTWHPHEYQFYCVMRGLFKKYLAYFLDPGLGKTSIILYLTSMLFKRRLIKGVLVVAPLRPCFLVWPKEVKKWRNFRHLKIQVLHKEGYLGKKLKKGHHIYVVNPEGLSALNDYLERLPKGQWPFDMLVVDESTKFKNVSTMRFKELAYIIPRMKRRYILTGTPVPNGLINIQGQMAIVDRGETFGITGSEFKRDYFKRIKRPEWDIWVPKSKESEDQIYKRAAKYCIRIKGSDHLDLPKRVNNIIWVKLPKRAQKHYDEVEKKMYTVTDSGLEINVEFAAAVTIKCHQMANGRVYADDDPLAPETKTRTVIDLHEAKLDALEDLHEELDHKPLLVAYRFQHDLDALKKRFGSALVSLGAGVSMKKAQTIEHNWNRGKISMLAAYPGSAALGLNLQQCGNNVAWYSIIDPVDDYEQFIQRIERQGQKESTVFNHLIFAMNTVDVLKYNNLIKKDKTQTNFLNAVEKYGQDKYRRSS